MNFHKSLYNKNLTFIFVMVVVVAVSTLTNYHAGLTLPCWNDEAIMSDIAYNFQRDGVWRMDISYSDIPPYVYGPIYFYLQKFIIELFGFSALTIRSVNAVATYLSAFLVTWIVLLVSKRKVAAFFVLILFLLDTSINRAAVVGRMDMVATLFALLSFYFALKYSRSTHISFREIGLGSTFGMLAFLTTPRAAFLLPGALFLIIKYTYSHFKVKGEYFKLAVYYGFSVVIFLLPIILWINSIGGFELYFNSFHNSPLIGQHEGFSLFRKEEDYILLPLFFSLFLLSYKQAIKDPLILGILLTFSSFTFFVKEIGPYRPMILPYLYIVGSMMAVKIYENAQIHYRKGILYTTIAVVFLVSTPVFLYRTVDIWLINSASREARPLQLSLLNSIPPNSYVSADYDYYYLLKPQSKKFIAFDSFQKHSSTHDQLPDYIVLNRESNALVLKSSSKWTDLINNKYKVIGTYICNFDAPSIFSLFISRRNYNGTTVYVRL